MNRSVKEDLVSIIVPVYNKEKYILDSINSVQNQTYKNWELILIDDFSSDNCVSLIKQEINKDKRIKLHQNEKNSGPAISRNNGIYMAKGRYICYLDADDLWIKDKLEKQVNFMKNKQGTFSFTGYEFANANGVTKGKKVYVPETINYKEALKNTTISTITVMFDMERITKEEILMPNIGSEDTACWWKILRNSVKEAYGLNEILSIYRRSENTLSSNKIEGIRRIWNLYRNQEQLNLFDSLYNFLGYAFNAVKRRL